MADLNDLNKPDTSSSYTSEVLQTLRSHVTRLWTGDYTGMGGLVAGMRRWVEIPGGDVKLLKRNNDGSETAIFDSSQRVSKSYVDSQLANETSARIAAVNNEAANRSADVANEVGNRNSAIAAEATARANADNLKANRDGTNATGTWPINITGNSANGGVRSVNGQVGDVSVSSPTKLSQLNNDVGFITGSGSTNYANSAGNGVAGFDRWVDGSPYGSQFFYLRITLANGGHFDVQYDHRDPPTGGA